MQSGLPELQQSYPPRAASVAAARRDVADFARRAGLEPERIDDVRLAVSEALTNAIQHAFIKATPGNEVTVTAIKSGDELWVLVADNGSGMRNRDDSPGLGLGLALINQTTDGFDLVHEAGQGTELRMCFTLRGRGGSAQRARPLELAEHPESPHWGRGSWASAMSPPISIFSTTA